jgi:osomolarity two-component system sensor histidine kinase SLN1
MPSMSPILVPSEDEKEDTREEAIASSDDGTQLSVTHLTQHNMRHESPAAPLETIVVRIEVTDTGYGIRPRDMFESKLFCEFASSL